MRIGSGLFDVARADAAQVALSLATDVGGGTSFSMLQSMNELYKVARMCGSHLSGLRMFYLATLGAARCMRLEGTIGNFVAGAEADFIVLDPQATPLLARPHGDQQQPGRAAVRARHCWATTAALRQAMLAGSALHVRVA